jgi:hypothetical protein
MWERLPSTVIMPMVLATIAVAQPGVRPATFTWMVTIFVQCDPVWLTDIFAWMKGFA